MGRSTRAASRRSDHGKERGRAIKSPAQLDAAVSFLSNVGPEYLDIRKFEEASGVRVVVSIEDIHSTVAEEEIEKRLAEILGPKTEADNVKPVKKKKEKPSKVEEKEVAVATAAPPSEEELNPYTIFPQPAENNKEVIASMRRESEDFDKAIDPSHHKAGRSEGGGAYENGHVSSHSMQVEDQRNGLHTLQQSIARELEFEKELCDSGAVVEELKMKLHHSKLSASRRREGDLKSKLEQSLVQLNALEASSEMTQNGSEMNASQEAMQSQRLSTPEFFTLHHKVQKLEEWVSTEANAKEQNMSVSERNTFENIMSDMKDAISKAESRTQNIEARCAELIRTNVQLNGELNSLEYLGSDRAGLLEQRLMESEAQLEHATPSFEANAEQNAMLRSIMSDMEHVIQDQKEKYLKAETRAESAESKCTLLADTNLELNKELTFLRGRVESLENSLRHANRLKLSTAKDIGIKTKISLTWLLNLHWKENAFMYSLNVMNLLYMSAYKL
ncbi:hypothetical protein ACQ4PT_001815 [Festuca glaucescens]